ncbi:ALS2 C-terminal-like protein isoform X2 [Latimeria chalumnae]|uniref:ALS2 C-terminal-like protein isoform X2 n=1 Tax=Latimeria chalumnae TaxID=7897 RepID=UPI00313C3560
MSHPHTSSHKLRCSVFWDSSISSSPGDPSRLSKEEEIYKDTVSALLQVEESFLESLAQINSKVLHQLLQTGSDDQKGTTRLKLLLMLNDRFHALWEQTDENYRKLKRQSHTSDAPSLQGLHIIKQKDSLLQRYVQYFSSFTNFAVVGGFDYIAKQTSDYWKKNRASLKAFFPDSELRTPIALYRIFHEPIRFHVQEYTLLLSGLNEKLKEVPERELTDATLHSYVDLQVFISQVLDEASLTKVLWKSLGHRLVEVLCCPERRLQEDSKRIPLSLTSGKSSTDRFLLFDDIFVFLQVVWLWKLNQAVRQCLNKRRDFPLWGKGDERDGVLLDPPVSHFSSYTFKNEGRFRNAVYEGEWNRGKPHGKGTMKWPDSQNYTGDFKDGQEDGFGILLIPGPSPDRYDCYKSHWKAGVRDGYGICEYADGSVYRGHFKENLRHGFGVLETSRTISQPFRYTGHWNLNQKTGYGVWDDFDRGERYIGLWQEDSKHGDAIVVTQSGLCYQGFFQNDKMTGAGILLAEDDSTYEGEFTEELMLNGKGKLTFANGFTLEGTFSRQWGNGIQATGILTTAGAGAHKEVGRKKQLQLCDVPVEMRWKGAYDQFRDFLHSDCRWDMEESFLGFHIQSNRASNGGGGGGSSSSSTQEYLFCQRKTLEDSKRAENLTYDLKDEHDPEKLLEYLTKAFESTRHPLGKLLKTLSEVFQATFSGIGANKHLLSMAQEEVQYHIQKIEEFTKSLLLRSHDERKESSEELNCHSMILSPVLPRFYPDLFMIYMLHHEAEDALYWQGIIHLGLLSDTKLLEFLEVQKHLWPLKDLELTTNQRYSLTQDECFFSAIECFQKISATADPQKKQETFLKTYEEVEKTVSRVLGKEYKLPMDDLLPLLVYVVSRARIQRLGAELHLIRDMMDPINIGGIHDFLLTALESCYQHIQKEEIRHGRFE